jgi:hypothetical protein
MKYQALVRPSVRMLVQVKQTWQTQERRSNPRELAMPRVILPRAPHLSRQMRVAKVSPTEKAAAPTLVVVMTTSPSTRPIQYNRTETLFLLGPSHPPDTAYTRHAPAPHPKLPHGRTSGDPQSPQVSTSKDLAVSLYHQSENQVVFALLWSLLRREQLHTRQ